MGIDVGKICHCRHKGGRSQGHWSQGKAGREWVVVWWCKSWGLLIVSLKNQGQKPMGKTHSILKGRYQMSLFRVWFDFWKEHELRQGMWGPTESIQWAAFQGRHCFGTRTKLTSSAKYSETKASPQTPKELWSLWAWAVFPYLNSRWLISWNLDGMLIV